MKSATRHLKSQKTVSKKLNDGWFSKRTHGFVQPVGRRTIVNTREPISRNRRVSVDGAQPMKLKHTALYRTSPIPYSLEANK